MFRIFNAELYKIRHNITIILSIILSAPLGILFAFIAQMDKTICSAQILGGLATYYKIFFVVLIIMYITLDYERGTIKAIISSGVSKTKIYFGRMLVSICVAEAMFLLAYIGAALTVSVNNIPMSSSVYSWSAIQYIESIFVQMLIVAAYAMIAYFVGVLIKKQVAAIMVAAIVINFESLIIGYLGKATHLNLSMLDFSTTIQNLELLNVNGSVLLGALIYAFIIFIFSFVIGVLIFKNRDI